jgi:hypothetical protein
MEPPPPTTVNWTTVPATADPFESATLTDGLAVTAEPTVAERLVAVTAVTLAGDGGLEDSLHALTNAHGTTRAKHRSLAGDTARCMLLRGNAVG